MTNPVNGAGLFNHRKYIPALNMTTATFPTDVVVVAGVVKPQYLQGTITPVHNHWAAQLLTEADILEILLIILIWQESSLYNKRLFKIICTNTYIMEALQ